MFIKGGLFTNGPEVGNYYQGGFVVYYNAATKQGLIVSPTDLTGSQCAWEVQPYTTISTSDTYGSGATNTTNIIASTSSTPAADLCDAYSNDGYTDWFLPNKTELLYVWTAYYEGKLDRANLKGFRTSPGVKPFPYWTSYSQSFNTAWFVDFAYPSDYLGNVGQGFRDTGTSNPGPGCWVRACRYMTFL
jgi:hypothetical protein